MSKETRSDMPGWVLAASEKVQSLEDRLPLAGLIKLIAGSDSPSYVQAAWHKAEFVVNEYEKPDILEIAEADPDASSLTSVLPRLKRKAVVVSAGRLSIHDLKFGNIRSEPAIAYTYRDKTYAGTLPDGLSDLGSFQPDTYTAALRTGRNDFGAALGIWVARERTFILPRDAKILDQNIPIRELANQYPGTPLV